MNLKISTAIALAIAIPVSSVAFAKSPPPASAEDVAAYELKLKLKELYPNTPITGVSTTPMSGVFEIAMGKNIAYTDIKGEQFLFGKMFDMKTQADLTTPRLEALNKIDLSILDKSKAIKTVKGDGSRTLYVFSDPDCPYCKRLEQTLRDLTNVTIYTFLFPLERLHPEARAVGESVWCAKDRVKAWDDYMLRDVKPSSKKCENPIDHNLKVAAQLGIAGTPTMINGNGTIRAGALPLGQIDAFLK